MTREEYDMGIMESMIGNGESGLPGRIAAEAGDLVLKMVGVNALTEAETRQVLAIVHAAYAPGPFHAPLAAKAGMLALLRQLASEAERDSLKHEIAQTVSFVEAQ